MATEILGSQRAPDEIASASKISWHRPVLRVSFSVFTLAVLVVILPRDQLLDALGRVCLAAWAVSVAIHLSLHFLGVLKWRLTVNLGGAGLGLVQAARCYSYWKAGAAAPAARRRPGYPLGRVARPQSPPPFGPAAGG